MRLTDDEVLAFLKEARPDLTERDWRNTASLITVLSWALPNYAKQQNKVLENDLKVITESCGTLASRVVADRKRIVELEEVLGFYAEERNHLFNINETVMEGVSSSSVTKDIGQRAREALGAGK